MPLAVRPSARGADGGSDLPGHEGDDHELLRGRHGRRERHDLERVEADGQREEAVKVYQETVKLLPRNPDVRLALAQCLSKLATKSDGDGELSRAAIREAQSFLEFASPDDPRRELATEIITQAKNDEAKRMLSRAEFYLVKYHYRPDVARRYLLDVIREYPDSTSTLVAKALLELHFPADQATEIKSN